MSYWFVSSGAVTTLPVTFSQAQVTPEVKAVVVIGIILTSGPMVHVVAQVFTYVHVHPAEGRLPGLALRQSLCWESPSCDTLMFRPCTSQCCNLPEVPLESRLFSGLGFA